MTDFIKSNVTDPSAATGKEVGEDAAEESTVVTEVTTARDVEEVADVVGVDRAARVEEDRAMKNRRGFEPASVPVDLIAASRGIPSWLDNHGADTHPLASFPSTTSGYPLTNR